MDLVKHKEPDTLDSKYKNPDTKFLLCTTIKDIEKLNKKPYQRKNFTCKTCGKKFTTAQILNVHKLCHLHQDKLPFDCELCSFKASTKAGLLKHTSKHGPRSFKCTYCPKSFHNAIYQQQHIQEVHEPEIVLKCSQCSFTTPRKRVMRAHFENHGNKYKVACPLCDKMFQTESNLKAHLLTHTGDKLHVCDECGKKFSMRNRVNAHKLVVHGPKYHECKECSKTFPTLHHLKRHARVHSGDKPFKCCFCTLCSSTQSNLMKHVHKVHGKKDFTYRDVLKERNLVSHIPTTKLDGLKRKGKQIVDTFLKQRENNKMVEPLTIQQLRLNMEQKQALKAKKLKKKESVQRNTKKVSPVSSPQYYIQLPENYYALQSMQKMSNKEIQCFQQVSTKPVSTIDTEINKGTGFVESEKIYNDFESLLYDEDTRFSEVVLFVDE